MKAVGNRAKEVMALWEDINVEVNIKCSNCSNEDGEYNVSDFDFADAMYDKGWRSIDGSCLCPNCQPNKTK